MSADQDGGYDAGYKKVPCFWGTAPGSLVQRFLSDHPVRGMRVLDLGAGEGKNAAAFAAQGAFVEAVECSALAIANGKRAFPKTNITWSHADVMGWTGEPASYDVIVSYGLTHCLRTAGDARALLATTKEALRPNGHYVLVAFNDGSHDLSAHEGFDPLLLPHAWFLQCFRGWDLLYESDTILHETHPNNNIPHHHSMTRLIARKPI